MPQYVIEAVTDNGRKVRTKVEAENQDSALQKVRNKGLKPTSCKAMEPEPSPVAEQITKAVQKKKKTVSSLFKSVSKKDIARFTQQFSVLLGAGVPIVRCLKILANQQRPGYFKDSILDIYEDVEQGSTLSDSLGKHPDIFDKLYVNMARAGEAGGVLVEIMKRLTEYMEKIEKLKSKMIGAAIYPIIVLTVAVIVVLAVMTLIVPKFKEVLSQLGGSQAMHPLTELIMDMSSLIVNRWYLLFVIVISFAAAVVVFLRTKKGQLLRDNVVLRLPYVGALVKKFIIARVCRTLGTLLKSGVPILEAITIVKNTTNNLVVSATMEYLYTNVKEGESITAPLSQSKLFDEVVVSMVDVGEETGELDNMLLKVADIYDQEVDQSISTISSLIEPALILMLGGVVGIIVLALFLPMMGIIKSFSQKGM